MTSQRYGESKVWQVNNMPGQQIACAMKISDAKGLRSLFGIADFVHTSMATEAPQRADSIAQATEKAMSTGFRRKEEERYYDRRDF